MCACVAREWSRRNEVVRTCAACSETSVGLNGIWDRDWSECGCSNLCWYRVHVMQDLDIAAIDEVGC
jgi:hypothetical protein